MNTIHELSYERMYYEYQDCQIFSQMNIFMEMFNINNFLYSCYHIMLVRNYYITFQK